MDAETYLKTRCKRNPLRAIRRGLVWLGVFTLILAWSLQAGSQAPAKRAVAVWDERDQLPEPVGPNVYNAPAYARMKGEVMDSVKRDPLVANRADFIRISAADGILVLEGTVNNAMQKERVLAYALEAAGMTPVKDQLSIAGLQ